VPDVVILPRANAQIIDVLDFTREEFGEAKYLEYRELISLALATLAATPTAGKHRPEIHPDAWTYSHRSPGSKGAALVPLSYP
jgi:plasmid stabilization system protein ParE